MYHLRTWEYGPFKLELYDALKRDHLQKDILGYALYHDAYGTEPIFEDSDFSCSPLHAIDSDATVAALLHFLALKPGDTDSEYFENYTDRQMEFAQDEGEELSMLAYELEQQGEYGNHYNAFLT